MKRDDFFKLCAGGVCGCAAMGFISGNPAIAGNTTQESEDWRIGFMQERFAKLISILGDQFGIEKRNEVLELLGRECAKHYFDRALSFKGDLKGYLDDIQKDWVEKAEYDEAAGKISVTDKLVKKCACPFVDTAKMDSNFCNCTVGWQKEIYSLVSGKEVDVKIESSVLRGNDKCVYSIVLR